ncbi:MAG: CDP-alcohol phosphatidyltransferase family protein [Candidatus Hodarchaeales archaeon]|jgi:CDP-diacylglycerol--serine O-phosphatidyltransferase
MNALNKYTLAAHLFTLSNALAGITGIYLAINYSDTLPFVPLQLVILGAIFDFLDGFMAKRAPSTSSFGVYADSVSDVLTFAILPGIMVLQTNLIGTNSQGYYTLIPLIIAGFYTISGWIRLIRFATNPTSIYYEGLPSPAAALLIGTSATLATLQEAAWLFAEDGLILSLLTIMTSFLMIEIVHYPSPKRGHILDLLLIIFAGLVVISFVFFPNILTLSMILFISLLYTIFGSIYLLVTKKSK